METCRCKQALGRCLWSIPASSCIRCKLQAQHRDTSIIQTPPTCRPTRAGFPNIAAASRWPSKTTRRASTTSRTRWPSARSCWRVGAWKLPSSPRPGRACPPPQKPCSSTLVRPQPLHVLSQQTSDLTSGAHVVAGVCLAGKTSWPEVQEGHSRAVQIQSCCQSISCGLASSSSKHWRDTGLARCLDARVQPRFQMPTRSLAGLTGRRLLTCQTHRPLCRSNRTRQARCACTGTGDPEVPRSLGHTSCSTVGMHAGSAPAGGADAMKPALARHNLFLMAARGQARGSKPCT